MIEERVKEILCTRERVWEREREREREEGGGGEVIKYLHPMFK